MSSDDTWKKKTFSFDALRARGILFDQDRYWGPQNVDPDEAPTMLDFLRYAGVVPEGVTWKRKNAQPRNELKPDAIPAVYLAEVAYEWDEEGPSTVAEFLDSLEFEVLGTPRNQLLNETMADLGREY